MDTVPVSGTAPVPVTVTDTFTVTVSETASGGGGNSLRGPPSFTSILKTDFSLG